MKKGTEKPEPLVFYERLLLTLYREMASTLPISVSSLNRDLSTLSRRIRGEGLSFLTKTLPSLGKNLDRSLASDCPLPRTEAFAYSKVSGFPTLFGDLWRLIYTAESDTGGSPFDIHMLTDPSGVGKGDVFSKDDSPALRNQRAAIRAVRQVCYLFYKLEGVCTDEDVERTVHEFVETDTSLPHVGASIALAPPVRRALENARLLLGRVLANLDLVDIIPGHGPGAVATGERLEQKMRFKRLYATLEEVYPFVDYFFFSYTHLCDNLEVLDRLMEVDSGTMKMVPVPKDSRGPRLISEEPLEIQWIQQGQKDKMYRYIESHRSTAGFVNFENQQVNRELALKHSVPNDDNFVTMDMKEASDRVSLWLVDQIFPPHIKKCIYASRSGFTKLPGGHTLQLRKFAPMGSSICFPIEALTFWALGVGSLRDIRTVRDFRHLPPVYVYGDDIIVRSKDYEKIHRVYEDLFLRVNVDKTCTGKFFRESCGMDAFKSEDVSPIRCKVPYGDWSPAATLAFISLSNRLRERGWCKAADLVREACIRETGQIPTINVREVFPFAFVDVALSTDQVLEGLTRDFSTRINRKYCRREIRLRCPGPLAVRRGTPGWDELLRLSRYGSVDDPFGFGNSESQQCRHVVPHQLKMRYCWVELNRLLS